MTPLSPSAAWTALEARRSRASKSPARGSGPGIHLSPCVGEAMPPRQLAGGLSASGLFLFDRVAQACKHPRHDLIQTLHLADPSAAATPKSQSENPKCRFVQPSLENLPKDQTR